MQEAQVLQLIRDQIVAVRKVSKDANKWDFQRYCSSKNSSATPTVPVLNQVPLFHFWARLGVLQSQQG